MRLNDNPFYVLNVSLSDNKSRIVTNAEELGFFYEESVIDNAQRVLLNPVKRLEAELSWFPPYVEDEVLNRIRAAIEKSEPINEAGLDSYGLLNTMLYNAEQKGNLTGEELQILIERLDEVYEVVETSAKKITYIINSSRSNTGLSEVSVGDVESEIQSKRDEIRSLINKQFTLIEDKKYVEIVNAIAEKHLENDSSECGPVIEDVINQYEIRLQSTIEEKTELLLNKLQLIITISNTAERNNRVDDIIASLKEWDNYVQPLQLKARYEGQVHGISEDVAIKVRNASVDLHNRREDINNAEKLLNALKIVFAEMPEFLSIIDSDADTIEKNKEFVKVLKQQERNGCAAAIIGRLLSVIIFIAIMSLLIFATSKCSDDSSTDNNESTQTEEAYDDSEEKVTLKEKKMPENEHIFVNKFNERPSQIVVNNPTKDAFYMKFENKKGKTVFAFFVRPKSEAPMYMGLGTFYLKYASGRKWYGKKHLFGDETNYYESDEEWPFVEGKYWKLDLRVQENGNAGTYAIPPEEF